MLSEFDREVAQARTDQERDASLKAATQALREIGTLECIDCGATIPPARRRVYPSARRCLECQTAAEREAYLR
ncbi:TraR/DksA C4-type zinc finger protein [Rhizobium straminoryzae]|uniref:TraR/DksA family transcriptional regulator n=1 Tax=Rhizobium straminoryzae TaxID=1387186 RepID=A0A549T852_9HYPH|nr:TraR/DksA C4-type zinc finger protein [Rhizobium straminoryzae]TRL38020.1 TraR/DksA family transcriptional regulator [Rhizobium straminoryzae]